MLREVSRLVQGLDSKLWGSESSPCHQVVEAMFPSPVHSQPASPICSCWPDCPGALVPVLEDVSLTMVYPMGFITAACKYHRGRVTDCSGFKIVGGKPHGQTLFENPQYGIEIVRVFLRGRVLCSHLVGGVQGHLHAPFPIFDSSSAYNEIGMWVWMHLIMAKHT